MTASGNGNPAQGGMDAVFPEALASLQDADPEMFHLIEDEKRRQRCAHAFPALRRGRVSENRGCTVGWCWQVPRALLVDATAPLAVAALSLLRLKILPVGLCSRSLAPA